MNFGGEHSADGLQFGQAAKPPIGHPRMALCPCPSRARGGVAAEDAHCSERLIGSRRARRPRPGNVGVEGRVSDRPTVWRTPPWHHPQRTPGRKPGSGALIEPTIGLRIVNLAKHQVPRVSAGPSSELPLRRIANLVQPWSKETILRRLRAKTHDSSRYRKPIREQPTKTSVSHFRDREKPSVLTASDQNRRFFASRIPQGEGAAPSSKGLCKRHGTKHGFLYMLEPLTERKRLRAPAASRYSVRKRKRRRCAKERTWRRLG